MNPKNLFKNHLTLTTLIGIFSIIFMSSLSAQRAPGDVGIGFQAGQPTGLSVKIYNPGSLSPEILAAWDLDNFFFLNLTGLLEHHLNSAQTVHFFYGPGAFIGIRERGDEFGNDDVVFGISGSAGLNFLIQKLEIFIQGTPRLSLIESTDFDMGGGLGMRYYF